jgi:hypothetical protein
VETFDSTTGQNPFGGLTLDGNTLFGTTTLGGMDGEGTIFDIQLQEVPEPSTWALILTAAAALTVFRRRRSEPAPKSLRE